MDESLFKLFTQFGVSGLIGWLLWVAMKERISDTKDRVLDMKERVTNLEKKVEECEQDREELWKRLSEHKRES